MSSKTYAGILNTKRTAQSEPIPGKEMAPNSAGGYSFQIDDWTKLTRFLILGSSNGSYYASEKALTQENAKAVLELVQKDGLGVVQQIVAISKQGRAPKNDPAIFALAVCAAHGNDATRKAALAVISEVCRIGTHLFHFAEYVDGMRGWGRGLRDSIASWYTERSPEDLAYQAIKYQQRDGWSHRDLLRKTHPNAPSVEHNTIFNWIVKQGEQKLTEGPDSLRRIIGFDRIKTATSAKEAAALITEYDLPRECVPTEFLNEKVVWEALLPTMPLTAMIRNLATMTRVGIIAPMSDGTAHIIKEITDGEKLKRSRVHPIQVLSAALTYGSGQGQRGQHTWNPVSQVVDALDSAFYASFGNVEPTGKRIMLALDVSGSMNGGVIAGVPGLTPRIACAAIALITAAVEPLHHFMAFSGGFIPLDISPRQRLNDVCRKMNNLPFDRTDCSQPMLYAQANKIPVDGFVVFTDSETWCGTIHASQALKQYRNAMGINSRSAVVGAVANNFTIADPKDAGMMDFCGFDTATPQIMSDFIAGKL